MITIDWIRHTSLVVKPDLCYGQTDIKVAPSFEEEATQVKAQLQEREYDHVFTSPLTRAKVLAHYCGYTNATEEKRIMERNFGEWEEALWSNIFALVATDEGKQYLGRNEQLLPPGGETLDQLLTRVQSFIDDVRTQRWERVAVFCHGGVINSARFMRGEVEQKDIFYLVPPYGSVTTLHYSKLDERLRV